MRSKKDLHPYQHEAIQHIIDNDKAGLFLEMGLGKTVSALTAIKFLMFAELEISKTLIIGTKRVAKSVWTNELEEWDHLKGLTISVIAGTEKQRLAALKKPADIYTIGRDNVAWLCGLFAGGFLPFDMVVIDELTSFKNPDSVRFKALKNATVNVNRIVGLTGSPAPKGLIDLWAQIFLLDRGERLEKNITKYREGYFRRDYACAFKWIIRDGMADIIHNKVKDLCISMRSADYLKLPPKIDRHIYIDMPPKIEDAYYDFERQKVIEMFDSTTEVTAVNAAALCNKLQQFAGGNIYDEHKNVHHLHNLKIEALEEIVEAQQGNNVIVAYAFQHERDAILQRFKSIKPRVLDTDKDEREWNAGKIEMLVMHPASGGHGLNLQNGGNIIIWYGNTWSLEHEQQMNARLFRQGQKKPVFVYKLITKGTVDEDIIRSQESKEETQNALMDATKKIISKYRKTGSF